MIQEITRSQKEGDTDDYGNSQGKDFYDPGFQPSFKNVQPQEDKDPLEAFLTVLKKYFGRDNAEDLE